MVGGIQIRVGFMEGIQLCQCLSLGIVPLAQDSLNRERHGGCVVGMWHDEVPIELTLEPSLPPATPRASKGIPRFSQALPEWGLVLVEVTHGRGLGSLARCLS